MVSRDDDLVDQVSIPLVGTFVFVRAMTGQGKFAARITGTGKDGSKFSIGPTLPYNIPFGCNKDYFLTFVEDYLKRQLEYATLRVSRIESSLKAHAAELEEAKLSLIEMQNELDAMKEEQTDSQ